MKKKKGSLSNLDDEQFRRLTGVKRETFAQMLKILRDAHKQKKARGGRKNTLSVRAMLLMTLEYLREYRTYFHVGADRGLTESAAQKNIRWVEDTLVKDGMFSLPGKKALLRDGADIEVILIDATESPVQRPKKDNGATIRARRNVTH
jgi:hypothetical protein